MCGCLESYEGTYNMPQSSGTFKVSVRGQVSIFSASGGFLGALRAKGLYDSYLMIFADYEYRISMMHATVDFRVDAPGYITDLYQKILSTEGKNPESFPKCISTDNVAKDSKGFQEMLKEFPNVKCEILQVYLVNYLVNFYLPKFNK